MKQKNIFKKSFSDMWDSIKWINMHVIKVPERGRKILEEIIAKTFLNLATYRFKKLSKHQTG